VQKGAWLLSILSLIMVILLGVLIFVPRPTERPPTPTSGITVLSPKPNQEVSSPFKITGMVNGDGWTGFEGQVGTVQMLDYKGNVIGQTYLPATSEWTSLPTNFEATINFAPNSAGPVVLLFKNENASGDPIRDKTFSLPIRIKSAGETMTVKAYFGKTEITGSTCSVVFPVERIVTKTEAVARVALEELLKGPTQAEKDAGYFTSIPAGSKLNSIAIVNGEARADFNEATQSGGGSCSMAERVSEIRFTLLQFLSIKSVKLSVNGQTEAIFQP
jgi:hypothetical protein